MCVKKNIKTDTKQYTIIEKELYPLWINFCRANFYLPKLKLKGIDAGVLNLMDGPDFQGAEFELNRKIYRGDVEIHTKYSDWFNHGHHLNPHYDRVVLHLIWDKISKPVFNSKNQKVPTISLAMFPQIQNHDRCLDSCSFVGNENNHLILTLQSLALQRMMQKANTIDQLNNSFGFDQSLYLMLLKSLGHVSNQNNYQRMADLIPWHLVRHFKEINKPLIFWESLYLGTAGFVTNHSDPIVQKHWHQTFSLLKGIPLNKQDWKFGGIRPNNHPQIRLKGLAHFLWQMQEQSIFNALQRLFYQRLHPKDLVTSLQLFFSVCNCKQEPMNFAKSKALWGKSLLVEFCGNIFIPLFYKMALKQQSYGFLEYLQELYFQLPFTCQYASLNNLYKNLKSNKINLNRFYINQALLHLKNNFCLSSHKAPCPLKSIPEKN